MAVYKHPQALVESEAIGDGTRIWAFAHVMSGAEIGRDCNVGEHCFIEKGAVLGDRVTVKNHVAIWSGITVGHGVFIGPSAALTNDFRPRSRQANWTLTKTTIGEGATIGANATIVCGIEIGPFAFVGAGAVVTSSIPAHALVYGNPARRHGFVCECAEPLVFKKQLARCTACQRRYKKDRSGRLQSMAGKRA